VSSRRGGSGPLQVDLEPMGLLRAIQFPGIGFDPWFERMWIACRRVSGPAGEPSEGAGGH
jgi:hypothetical protein